MPSLRDATPDAPAPVRALALALSDWIGKLGQVWIEGQVAQLSRRPGLQTVFLTLRDSHADISVRVTCSRTLVDSMNPPLVEGASVVVLGKPSYYATNGTLSFAVREIRVVGLGELLARLEQRRQLLAAEGLFDPALKRELPFLPRAVGLVTAPKSAAERDVVENARRRWPAVEIRPAYATVQGPRAALEVIEAIERLDRDPAVEVIIVARGGGSIEDLLPFSDEALVRAVRNTRTPIVSAIGHEQDGPLLDLAADVRASTPTDAAKQVVPDVAEELARVVWARDRLRSVVGGMIERERTQLQQVRARPVLADPASLIRQHRRDVSELTDRARRSLRHRLDRAHDEIGLQAARARALSPWETLRRGYAVVQDAEGHVVTSIAGATKKAPLAVRVADGRLHTRVVGIEAVQLTGPDTTERREAADGS